MYDVRLRYDLLVSLFSWRIVRALWYANRRSCCDLRMMRMEVTCRLYVRTASYILVNVNHMRVCYIVCMCKVHVEPRALIKRRADDANQHNSFCAPKQCFNSFVHITILFRALGVLWVGGVGGSEPLV